MEPDDVDTCRRMWRENRYVYEIAEAVDLQASDIRRFLTDCGCSG